MAHIAQNPHLDIRIYLKPSTLIHRHSLSHYLSIRFDLVIHLKVLSWFLVTPLTLLHKNVGVFESAMFKQGLDSIILNLNNWFGCSKGTSISFQVTLTYIVPIMPTGSLINPTGHMESCMVLLVRSRHVTSDPLRSRLRLAHSHIS